MGLRRITILAWPAFSSAPHSVPVCVQSLGRCPEASWLILQHLPVAASFIYFASQNALLSGPSLYALIAQEPLSATKSTEHKSPF